MCDKNKLVQDIQKTIRTGHNQAERKREAKELLQRVATTFVRVANEAASSSEKK
jgi:hypothetical protein